MVTERQPLKWAIVTALFVSLVFGYTWIPNPHQLVEMVFGLERGSVSLAPLVLIWMTVFLAVLLMQAALFHLAAILLGGRGSYVSMLCGLCFACFPLAFFAPLAMLRALTDSLGGHILYSVGSLILFIWILLLGIVLMWQAYGLSLPKSIAACLVPALITFAVPPLIIVALSV